MLNPYAPPKADINASGAATTSPGAIDALASRSRRFWGAFVDGFMSLLAMAPAYLGVSWPAYSAAAAQSNSSFLLYRMGGKMGIVAAVLSASLYVANWVLLTKRGQTIGKIVAGTRVVRLDGGRSPFVNVVAIRTWPLLVLSYVPLLLSVTGALAVIDMLFIFRRDRRCLHDLVAGTKVIPVEPQSAP